METEPIIMNEVPLAWGNDDTCEPVISSSRPSRTGNTGAGHRTGRKKVIRMTVPEPFKMTLRGEVSNQVRRRPQNEAKAEIECLKQFRAAPVPAHVFLPLYETMKREQRQMRDESIERSKARMLAEQRPFSFDDDKQKQSRHRRRSNSVPNSTAGVNVEQAPIQPESVAVKRRLDFFKKKSFMEMTNEEQLLRECRIKLRAEKLLKTASLPPSMKQRLENRVAAAVGGGLADELSTRNAQKKRTTIVAHSSSEDFVFTSTPIAEAKKQVRRRSKTVSDYDDVDDENFFVTPKMTTAAMMREATNRKKFQIERSEQQFVKSQKKKEELTELKRKIASKTATLSPKSDSESPEEKLRSFREADKARFRDYRLEMKNMTERVKSLPLLMEKQLQVSAVSKVERRFKERLNQGGIDEDLLRKLSQKAVLENSSSSEGRGSQSDDDDAESDVVYTEDENSQDYTTVEDSSEKTLQESTTQS